MMIFIDEGRKLDGSQSPYDQLAEKVVAVEDKIDVNWEGGNWKGTHV